MEQFIEQNKNTTQCVLDTTIRKQTQIRHELSYTQLEVKTNRTSFLCRNRNGHHSSQLLNLMFAFFIHILFSEYDSHIGIND